MWPVKNAITYLFIVFLAALVFYGGAGVNFVTYCCGDCRTEGVTVLLDDKCCDIHEHEHEPEYEHAGEVSAPVSACSAAADSCDVERVSFDWSRVHPSVFNLQPVMTDVCSSCFLFAPLQPLPSIKELLVSNEGDPPVVRPRIYLSLLTTLLI